MADTQTRDWRLYNIIVLGIAFMLIFTAFQTCGMTEASVLDGARKESNGTFTGNGFTSLAIIYATFAGANWIAPSVVSVAGPKLSMVIGGVLYCGFIASFLKPMTWLLYLCSVLIGIGAAIIWTGQGNYLTINSDAQTVGRNSGIFWALLQCSLVWGNLYEYFKFGGETEITSEQRTQFFIALTVVCAVGILVLLLLKNPAPEQALTDVQSSGEPDSEKPGPLTAFKSALRIFATKRMLLLSVAFAYTGFELTFFSGVYGTIVGRTGEFGKQAKSLIGLTGIFIGVGEILGGAVFGLLGSRTNRYGRDPIVFFGFVVHMICFYLIFLNIPADSPVVTTLTHKQTYIISNEYIAVLCGFLLGLGDSSFNTQMYSILADMYAQDSAPAFACFKFIQSSAAAGAFFYSNYVYLQYQLLILVVTGVAGTLCFFVVEWSTRKHHRDGYSTIGEDN